jgi:hypothetical protein
MALNDTLLSTTVDVRLSVSDWLLLVGWCGANVTADTPRVIAASIHSIAKQVRDA